VTKVITIEKRREREREKAIRSCDIDSVNPTFGSRYDPQFPEINKARVRYVRQTNGDAKSSPIPACSCPMFSFLVVEREERYSGRASAKTIALISTGHNTWLAGVSWLIKHRPPVFQRSALNVFEYTSIETAREITWTIWRKEKQCKRYKARRI